MAKHPRDVIVKVFRKEIKGMLNESDRKMMDSIKRNEREKYKRMRISMIKIVDRKMNSKMLEDIEIDIRKEDMKYKNIKMVIRKNKEVR